MGVRTIGTREARACFHDLLDDVSGGEEVVIQRYGKSIAALIPFEDYETLRGELESIRLALEAAEAYEEWKQGRSAAQVHYEVAKRWVPKGWWGKNSGWGEGLGGFLREQRQPARRPQNQNG